MNYMPMLIVPLIALIGASQTYLEARPRPRVVEPLLLAVAHLVEVGRPDAGRWRPRAAVSAITG